MSGGRSGDPLTPYRAKRDFVRTPEPAGGPRRRAHALPRFVIHEHSARRLHWDLRLERDGVLVCWAIPKGMPLAPKANHIAPHTEDHPLEYLDFEGEIPAGSYGAGRMTIWDRGRYECITWGPRKVEVALHGERLAARYALFAIGEGAWPTDWMIHRMDPPASQADVEPIPARVEPMLARAGALPRDDDAWAFEIKWDGIRAIAYCEPGSVRFESRNLADITATYPELARLGRALGSHRAVLDGEIVAFGADGRPSFGALATRMGVTGAARARRLAASTPVTYVIFDLLWLDGRSLMAAPYRERHEALVALGLRGERWQTPGHIVGRGAQTLQASRDRGLEGIVAKRLDSVYEPGRRSGAWIKLRNMRREALLIGGWTAGSGGRRGRIGALLLGLRNADGSLRYCGRVGGGFSEHELERLGRLLAPLAREESPFSTEGPQPPRGAHHCEPRLRAEVEFHEWTRDGVLRQPSYKGLLDDGGTARDATRPRGERASGRCDSHAHDSAAALVVHEAGAGKPARAAVDGRELALTNLDKLLYPLAGVRKRDVIAYYDAIAPVLLAHLAGRPLTVTRYPDGVDGKAFFQKQSPAHRPAWVATTPVTVSSRGRIDFTLAGDRATLIWLANLAALELHVPLARVPALDRPSAAVFDLDPGPPATIVECARVALWLHGMFERLGLRCFAKTSGSKGLQVYVPLGGGEVTYEQTKAFAHRVATLLEQAEPGLAVSRMTKSLRAGKVLIDWSQNDERKTTVCVYSLRARERPTVSTPLEWEEVEATLRSGDPESLAFEADAVLARVRDRGDLFAPVLSLVQALPAV